MKRYVKEIIFKICGVYHFSDKNEYNSYSSTYKIF